MGRAAALKRNGIGAAPWPSPSSRIRSWGAPGPCPPCSSAMKMPGQPSSETSVQASSAYVFDSASSRSRSSLKRAASRSRAVSLIALWSSVKSKFIDVLLLAHPRQAEHALGDDVLQDLRRAALDRVGARTQEPVGPVGVEDGALVAADVHRELRQGLVRLRPLQLRQRPLGAGLAALHYLRQAP